MKIEVYLKDPDGFYEGVSKAVSDSLQDLPLSDKERDVVHEERIHSWTDKLSKWVEYGEYVTLVFDLENNTATVKELNNGW